jgi:hypothetical protein
MTREEAKEYAKNMTYRDAVCNALQGKCIPYRKATLIKLYELLDTIEPRESKVQGMTREQAITILNCVEAHGSLVVKAKEMAIEALRQEQKTGHWIKHEQNGIGHIECSECLAWFLEPHLLRNSYCPNCGARMESEEQ